MPVATTVWVPNKPQKGEYALITADNIVDPADSSIKLIDAADSSIFIVSPDTQFTPIPATVWSANDAS